MHRVTVVAITILVGIGVRDAHADCTMEAAALRRQLAAEARSADLWNTTWALGFGGAVVGQLSLVEAEVNPTGTFDDRFETAMHVGALKAGLGLAARVVLPLRFAVPAVAADPCDDVRALHRAIARAGTKERRSMWLTLIGGTVVNLAGAIYLWAQHDLSTATLSFVTGLWVAPLHAWTQPRSLGKLSRRHRVEWTIGPTSIGATF